MGKLYTIKELYLVSDNIYQRVIIKKLKLIIFVIIKNDINYYENKTIKNK